MSKENVAIVVIVLSAVYIISTINTGITGYVINDLTGEFPGISFFLVTMLGILGLAVIKEMHDKN